ncbi:hypothetical protein [Streptomyces xinghaiensis]|uniref:hypothetical protein n=1 Tax=Streptomyces xinghaiensis TaxID=1038928 RepID=UPI002E13F26E|nr:hypothetical protein OG463_04630 [Streptomyces xinghaiensis]
MTMKPSGITTLWKQSAIVRAGAVLATALIAGLGLALVACQPWNGADAAQDSAASPPPPAAGQQAGKGPGRQGGNGPGQGAGAGAAPDRAAITAYRSCLEDHGADLPDGPGALDQLDASDPEVEEALADCATLKPARPASPASPASTSPAPAP